jgi:TolB-like protein
VRRDIGSPDVLVSSYKKQRRFCIAVLLFLFITISGFASPGIAILPFSGGHDDEGGAIAELFSFQDEITAYFNVIPRTKIAAAIDNEHQFQLSSGLTDPRTMAALGKQVGAQYVVAGSIEKLGKRNLLLISILKIDDLRQIAGDIATYAKIEDIRAKLPGMAGNIVAAAKNVNIPRQKLAVPRIDMQNKTADNGAVANTLAQILSIFIIESGAFAVYPRTDSLEQVLAEHRAQLSGQTADENQSAIGKGDNPDMVLSVIARKLGSVNMFNASILRLGVDGGTQVIGKSVDYNTLDDGIESMRRLASELTGAKIPKKDSVRPSGYFAAQKIGTGFLNLAFGAGSWISGDIAGGASISAGWAVAAGLLLWEAFGLDWDSKYVGVPGTMAIITASLNAAWGFARPWIFKGKKPAVDIAPTLSPDGNIGMNFSYSVKF